MKIFPELNSFSIISIDELDCAICDKEIGLDLLTYLREIDVNNELINSGGIIPIFDVEDGLYEVDVTIHTELSSDFNIHTSGLLGICGTGYLAAYNSKMLIENGKMFVIKIDPGYYKLKFSVDSENEVLNVSLYPAQV